MLRPLRDLVEQEGFWIAFAVGVLGVLGCILAKRRRGGDTPVTWVTIFFAPIALAVPLVIDGWFNEAGDMMIAVVLLSTAGLVATFVPSLVGRCALALPGAGFVALGTADGLSTALTAFVVLAVAAGAAAMMSWPPGDAVAGEGPTLLVFTLGGVYGCIPDTEHAAMVFATALPLLVVGVPFRIVEFSRAGGAAMAGIVVWLAAAGGSGRPGAVVGASACLGLLVLVPILRTLPKFDGVLSTQTGIPWVILVVHVAVVLACSRLGGLQESAALSAAVSATIWVFALATLWVWLGTARFRAPERSS